MAFNKKVLNTVLPFPQNVYLVEHDLWIVTVAECYYKTALILEPLIKYRRHGVNVPSGGNAKGYPFVIKAYRRMYRILQIVLIKLQGRVSKKVKIKYKRVIISMYSLLVILRHSIFAYLSNRVISAPSVTLLQRGGCYLQSISTGERK